MLMVYVMYVDGVYFQMFTKMWRGQLNLTTNKAFSNIFDHILRVNKPALQSLSVDNVNLSVNMTNNIYTWIGLMQK